ncbi:helix-turn-helix domain containing protein [Irregularibacter muris]|uniref:Helix-turn-helix domain containing protein n=1 Tax=Irregularibacter muris TaxID=1796619 RepID=A0AAE3HJ04_9FIRM|nr:helix-turn-helix domain-containing protein [Irregularibacter muris]MCR1900307.1 helix-turn-helix domain containing protein [Irregularibacter muris]
MATMKSVQHEMLVEKWRKIIAERMQSGMPVKPWCKERGISEGQYYYWLKVIREESLIKAGTLAVTGGPQFAEVKQIEPKTPMNSHRVCAVIQMENGMAVEICNGADPDTISAILNILKR